MTAPLENPAVDLELLQALRMFGAVIALIVAWFLKVFFDHSLGPILRAIGNVGFGGVAGVGSVHPLRFLVKAADDVDKFLTGVIAGCERAVVHSFGAMLWAFYDLAFTIVKFAYDANTAIDNVWARLTRDAVPAKAQVTKTQLRKLQAELAHDEIRLGRLEHAHAGAIGAASLADFRLLSRGIDRLKKEIAHVKTQIRGIEGTKVGTKVKPAQKVKSPAKSWTDIFTKTAAVALVGYALSKMRLGWVRCPNVGKFGKFICGFNSLLMDTLLAGLALVTVTEGIVPFAEQVQGVVGDFAPLIRKFWHANAPGHGGDRALGSATLSE